MPYGRLQQGREAAPNPSGLGVDVHLGVLEAGVAAPMGTSVDLQLPFGSLVQRSVEMEREDHGIGDLELRVRQSAAPLLHSRWLAVGGALGLVAPTGPYVARSDAANLPPEASYLTLGRGTTWWIAETDARAVITPHISTFAQLSARGPLARTDDGFAWGNEVRFTVGSRLTVITPWLASLPSLDLQWRGGATEPDPFTGARLDTANAGGVQLSASLAAVISLPWQLSFVAGMRVPLASDVTGNQLVPQIGQFVALAYNRRSAPRALFRPSRGRITVVDYWAIWCAPCAVMSRELEDAARRWPDVTIVKIDVDEARRPLPDGARGLPVVEIYDRTGARTVMIVDGEPAHVIEAVETLRRSP